MRVASLDFENTSSPCPDGLRERNDSGIRTCGIASPTAACASVMFDTYSIPYTRVCGKVLAYQVGSPDAFGAYKPEETIDSQYVDGVSLTHGSSPREHIWTFAAATDEYGYVDDGANICECSHPGRRGGFPPVFVGQDYFCDSAIPKISSVSEFEVFFDGSPLWDGAGCGPDSTCCSFNTPPWFYKELSSPTSDAIEMRVCCDQGRDNEDIAISSVEIFVL